MNGTRTAAVLLTLAMVSTAGAQTPSIVEGRLDERRLTGSLEREFTAIMREGAEASWIGYSVRGRGRSSGDGCWDGRNGRRTTPVKLEGSSDLFVLFRVENRAVGRIQIASPDCALDLGGLTLHWIANVPAAASLDWLSTFTRGDAPPKAASGAIVAIALHGDSAAVDRLIALAKDGNDRQTRSNALFWISQRAGDRAAGTIADAIEKDPDTEVKRRAVFALSQLPANEGVPKLIEVASSHSNPAVRKQAMFWLGQSKDPRALAFFERILFAK